MHDPEQDGAAAGFGALTIQVVSGAMTACSFGMAPGSLLVLPTNRAMCGEMPAATIMDNIPMMNIVPFGMCSSPSNPTVIAATAAASGVLTPMPCVPATVEPWVGGVPTVLVGSLPALTNSCQLMCLWSGVITVTMPGQFQALPG